MRLSTRTPAEAPELPSQVRVVRRVIRSVVVAALSVTIFVGTATSSFAGPSAVAASSFVADGTGADGSSDAATTGTPDPGGPDTPSDTPSTAPGSGGGGAPTPGPTDPSTDPGPTNPGAPSTTDPAPTPDPGGPTDTAEPTTPVEPTGSGDPATTTDPGTTSVPADPSTGPSPTGGETTGTTSAGSTTGPSTDPAPPDPTDTSGPTETSGAPSTTDPGAGSGTGGPSDSGTRVGRGGTRVGGNDTDGVDPSSILGKTLSAGAGGNPDAATGSTDSSIPASTTASLTLGPFHDSFAASSVSDSSSATGCPGSGTAQAAASDPANPVLPAGVYAGVHLTDAQAQTAALIISVGKGLKVTARGVRIALAVALQESSLQPWVVSGPYAGLFQQLPDPASGLYLDYDRYDATGATRMFFEQLLKVAPHYQTDSRSDWQIGEAVQQTGQGKLFDSRGAVAASLTKSFFSKVPAYDFHPAPTPDPAACTTDGGAVGASSIGLGGFNPGDIISDAVFYNAAAMNAAQVRAFIRAQGANCSSGWCLKNITVTTPDEAADQYCDAYRGAPSEDAATVITKVAVACHINPQVMLVTLQKESALLTRAEVGASTYAAAWGWHCPDSGPRGTANCDPRYAGFFAQAYGMAKQWARYKVTPGKYHYRAGQTAEVLWNVAQSGCGGSTVHILNTATASLYNYTPYQPNSASLAAYPGVGDSCSSYGNRNFYYLFVDFFGGTGGGSPISVHGVSVTIPDSGYVPANLAGKTVTAPNAAVARGIAAGLAVLGTPYVWGGGTNGGPADNGCSRGGGASNSCHGIIGFDCSGLTGYVLAQAGFAIPDNSAGQRSSGTDVPWAQALPGDIIGYPGHVAIYLGLIGGTPYLLEAPQPGEFVHIKAVYSGGSMVADSVMHRYWA